MSQAETVSLHAHLTIGMQTIELERQGKLEEFQALHHTMPLPAYLVKWAKKCFGAEVLIKTGWNWSEAEAEYGHGWLTKLKRQMNSFQNFETMRIICTL